MTRFDLTDFEWSVTAPLLPTKSRGVPRVDDRRVLSGILWRVRTGAPWADLPERYGPHTTCYNRFVSLRGLLTASLSGIGSSTCWWMMAEGGHLAADPDSRVRGL